MPERIQRSRARGWRMPEGAIYVGRPTFWGNEWTVQDAAAWGIPEPYRRAWCVGKFYEDAARWMLVDSWRERLTELRGHDLACWCPATEPCHADVLLELANAGASDA